MPTRLSPSDTPVPPAQRLTAGASREGRSTLSYALACLVDPPTLLAIGLLLLNDHLFKAVVPSWWTGKLSDLAGLYFFPFLVLSGLCLLEQALPRRAGSLGRVPNLKMGLALALSGLWFLALKAMPASNAYAVALLEALTGRTHRVVADPTDLIALAMLPLTWCRWKAVIRACSRQPSERLYKRQRWFGLIALIVASLATMATTPPHYPVSFGVVFDVAADAEDVDTLYASLATQRITKCEKPKGFQLLPLSCKVTEVEHTVETYRSQDGGRTWALYSAIGGYLWADPHTAGRLYVLNEEGLHRVEEGQARLLNVPFARMQVRFFPNGYEIVEVLPNTHALAFDPATPGVLYLADGNRILISTDSGETWALRSSIPLSARVSSLSVAPSAPQTLYAAAGSSVLRSDDGGRSWPHIAHLGDEAQVRTLAVHPATPGVVYVSGNGIWRSVDGGSTWRKMHSSGPGLEALVLHPADADLIYTVGRYTSFSDGAFYTVSEVVFSDDGGNTWRSMQDQQGWDIAVGPVDPHRIALALGERGVAVQGSLSRLPTPTPAPNLDAPTVVYASALALPALDDRTGSKIEGLAAGLGAPEMLYALGSEPLALGRSDDGGGSWIVHSLSSLQDDPPTALAIRPVSPTHPATLTGTTASLIALGHQTVYHLTWSLDGVEIERFPLPDLKDADHSLTRTVAAPRPLLTVPSAPDLLFTTAPGGILRSDDGGRTWVTTTLSLTNAHGLPLAATPTSPITLAVTPTLSLTPMVTPTLPITPTTPLTKSVARIATPSLPVVLAAAPSHSATLYAALDVIASGQRGQVVFRSDDGGLTWEPQGWLTESIRLRTLSVHPADPEIVYGGGNGLYQSGDGGVTWALLYPEIKMRTLAITPGDPRLLYAITDEGVAHSNDGGLTWKAICPGGLVNGPAEYLGVVIVADPDRVILFARPTRPDLGLSPVRTCQGLAMSRYDWQQGWQQSHEGLPVFVKEHR